MSMDKKMTLKDVAERTGISIYTLRFYAREGLFAGVHRDKNGTHIFAETDIETVYIIECLKKCGMSIREIRDFTQWTLEGDATIGKRLKLFREKYAAMKKEAQKVNEVVDALRYKVWFYETAEKAGSVKVHDTMKPEEIPDDMREIRSRMKHAERLA